ncbi:uncharacterized protein LOC135223305 [Macrobrachium nipponense]|uniref:uncharacterized protein LOC135223305 n=1 Tax=Macrobrachium nipponense TaxID=159736 RepID=UPI0030C80996
MAEDVSIHLDFGLNIDTEYWTPSHIYNWLTELEWWQWLIILKVMLVFWILCVTIIIPSIYMQVLLYTDEMTSRMLHVPASSLQEIGRLVQWAITRYSSMQKSDEFWKHRRKHMMDNTSSRRRKQPRIRKAKTPGR